MLDQVTSADIRKDANLLGEFFGDDSWFAWDTIDKVLAGLPLNDKELALYKEVSQRETVPKRVREFWAPIGRRGGKSRNAAYWAFKSAFFTDWSKVLPPGERGYVLMIFPDRRQGRVSLDYLRAFIHSNAMFSSMVERETRESIYLKNGIVLEIATCSFRSLRGYTVVCAICDEIAFWRNEQSAVPDKEILTALRPAMATVENSLLICISSPYSRMGELWKTYKKYFGQEHAEILVIQAPTRLMNPLIPQSIVDTAMEEDSSAASSEWLAQFRRDLEPFVSEAVLDSSIILDRAELPYCSGFRYYGFCDPSGGSIDSMTLAIAHVEEERFVLDALRERKPPFNPADVVGQFVGTLADYQLSDVHGDRYAAEWVRSEFRRQGVSYRTADKTRSEIYLEFLPRLNSGQIDLLDNAHMRTQFLGLERKTSSSGKESVNHHPGAHDDLANAAAGVLTIPSRRPRNSRMIEVVGF